MGLGFLKRIFGGGEQPFGEPAKPKRPAASKAKRLPTRTPKRHKPKPLAPLVNSPSKPYALASVNPRNRTFLDFRVGENAARLRQFGVPVLQTPEEIARWLKVPLKTLVWLGDYHGQNMYEKVRKKQHYHYKWAKKKSGEGHRLIEAPKPMLKHVQERILREILDKVPPHAAAHGFVVGRSIRTHAAAHAGKYVILKFDLKDFYPSIKFKRVQAVFRGTGYGLEAARWLARLSTNRIPSDLPVPEGEKEQVFRLRNWSIFAQGRHLPQGAPTSPALANLSAWALDVRLTGLAKKFGVTYTRYADDLAFSGSEKLMVGKSMNLLVRYVRGIVRNERFGYNGRKKKVVRRGSRQEITGLTVNAKPNIPRRDFDRLKAILNNCARKGPATQNRDGHENFRAHLQGRIGFVQSVNPQKAARLQKVFARIKW